MSEGASRNPRADLTPRMHQVLAAIREAGMCRIAVRKTQRRPGYHGRWRMARPQLSDEPTAYRAECAGRRLPIRTVEALLCRGELVPLRRGWSLCVRLRARDRRESSIQSRETSR